MSVLLQANALYKRFGGLVATNGLDLALQAGEVHALIGPNGAGKSTAIAQLSGEMDPDSGSILFEGTDITALPIHLRVRRGLTRSYQVTSILPEFTVLENLAMVCQLQAGHSFNVVRDARRDKTLIDPARAALARIGLAGREDRRAGELAHGEQRLVELAMALATNPRVLLLDEPMAGLGPTESQAMTETLRGLKGGIAILLVEHDMDAVFALADRVSVLVYGRVIASGTPDAIRADPAVREAYLGDAEEAM